MPQPLPRLLLAALLLCVPAPAAASPLFELVGSGLGTGGFSARTRSPSSASAYFNPALLPRAKQGLELGVFVLHDAIGVTGQNGPSWCQGTMRLLDAGLQKRCVNKRIRSGPITACAIERMRGSWTRSWNAACPRTP